MRTMQERQVCVLLPNKQLLECTVRVRARGREVLSVVLRRLGVSELQVLALAVLRDNEYLFVDLERKLSKYFGKQWTRGSLKLLISVSSVYGQLLRCIDGDVLHKLLSQEEIYYQVPFILFLRVQYYVESGRLILSSTVQKLYYAELRQKVLRSQSLHQEGLFFQLAASALQAEVGDLEPRGGNEEGGHYFLPEDYFPSWLIKRRGRRFLLQHCPGLHVELKGATRSQAALQFMREAGGLQDVPVTFYRMRREKKEIRSSVLLGVALKGVHIYQELEGKLCLMYEFSWTEIERITLQGSRFEIAAVGSLCLPMLVFYSPSSFHSKHILRHLTDSHRLHINTRDAVSYIQYLEDMQARQFYKEAYICDATSLAHRLQSLTTSMSDCSVAVERTTVWSEEEEDNVSVTEFEMCVDEPEEFLVDNPAEVSWLAELLHGASIHGPLLLHSSHWAAITAEIRQVLSMRADEGVSVD